MQNNTIAYNSHNFICHHFLSLGKANAICKYESGKNKESFHNKTNINVSRGQRCTGGLINKSLKRVEDVRYRVYVLPYVLYLTPYALYSSLDFYFFICFYNIFYLTIHIVYIMFTTYLFLH